MNRMLRILLAAAGALLGALLLAGCGAVVQEYSGVEASNPFTESTPAVSAVSAVSEAVSETASAVTALPEGLLYTATGTRNPLTGQNDLVEYMAGQRPVCVLVNNYVAALPQNGITEADLVIECEAEGGITRLLCFYADWHNAPSIGSVREARLHFLDLAEGFDAIMVAMGASDETTAAAKTRGYSFLNGVNFAADTLTWRDAELRKTRNTEHTVLTDGQRILNAVTDRKLRTARTGDSTAAYFQFAADGAVVTPSGQRAKSIYLPVGLSASYGYDAARGVYLRYLRSAAQTDLNNGRQAAVSNVVVLFAKQTVNAADETLITVELTAGEGYYFSMGAMQKIYWQKSGADNPLKLYDEQGYEITLNQGKTWINFVSETLADQVTWAEIGG